VREKGQATIPQSRTNNFISPQIGSIFEQTDSIFEHEKYIQITSIHHKGSGVKSANVRQARKFTTSSWGSQLRYLKDKNNSSWLGTHAS